MWEIYLQQIREEKELYDEEINSGASEKKIYELLTTAKEKWNMEIPQQYLDVLSRINGIEFNGFILYGGPKKSAKGTVITMAKVVPIRAVAISSPIANAISLPLNHLTIILETVIPAISTPTPKMAYPSAARVT